MEFFLKIATLPPGLKNRAADSNLLFIEDDFFIYVIQLLQGNIHIKIKLTSRTTIRMILSVTVMLGNIRWTDPPMPSKARFTITAITPMTSIAS